MKDDAVAHYGSTYRVTNQARIEKLQYMTDKTNNRSLASCSDKFINLLLEACSISTYKRRILIPDGYELVGDVYVKKITSHPPAEIEKQRDQCSFFLIVLVLVTI